MVCPRLVWDALSLAPAPETLNINPEVDDVNLSGILTIDVVEGHIPQKKKKLIPSYFELYISASFLSYIFLFLLFFFSVLEPDLEVLVAYS